MSRRSIRATTHTTRKHAMTINPFTLKELRQLTRTRAISASLMLFLFTSLAVAYARPVLGGLDFRAGADIFASVMGLLAFVTCIVLPLAAFAFLDAERGDGRHADLALLAPLPPSKTIDGKMCGAFALALLFTTAALPFGAFAYLMHGLESADMMKRLALLLLLSLVLIQIALAIAAMRFSRIVRWSIFIAALFFTSPAIMVLAAAGFLRIRISLAPLAPDEWIRLLGAAASVCILARGFAISSISPDAMERDAHLRFGALAVAAGWMLYALFADDPACAKKIAWEKATGALSLAIASHALMQRPGVSRRILAGRPRNIFLRIAWWPFSSGVPNGVVFAGALAAFAVAFDAFCLPAECALMRPARASLQGAGLLPADGAAYTGALAAYFMYVFAALLAARWLWRTFACGRAAGFCVPATAFAALAAVQTIPSLAAMREADIPEGAFLSMPFNISPEALACAGAGHLWKAGAALAATLLLTLASEGVRALLARRRAPRAD